MALDIRTIIFIIGVMQLMQVLVFFYQYRASKNIKGPGWWMMWSASETLGFFLIILRNIPSLLHYVIILQDTILFTGTLFLYVGVLRFFDKKVNLKFLITFFSTFFILHLYFCVIKDDLIARSVIFSFYISVISFLTAIAVYRNKTRPVNLTANLNTAIFILHGTVFAFHTVMIIASNKVPGVFESSLFNYIPYADALIAGSLWTFGFIIMVNQKLNSEINETKSRFELIFNTSPDAALISRAGDGMIIDFNETFTKVTGYTKEDIQGNSTLDLQFWKGPSQRAEIVKILNEHGFCDNYKALLQRKGGELFIGLFSAKIISLSGIPHILSVTRDITQREKEAEDMRLKNEELKQSNIEKDKLFSVIAHDLRNPFTAFMGLTEMMAEESSEMTIEQMHNIATELRKSSANLYGLLENLLEWSKVEQGLIRFNPISVKVLPLVEDSIAKLMDAARSKGIKIICTIPNELMIYVDINVFQSILRNIVSNAIKFTHQKGNIFISAEKTDDKSIQISVKDTGIGMNDEILGNLFKLDTQTNRKGTKGEPSTGLGLILCKGFIEKQGGRIRVESEEGKGSVFHFSIPHRN